jgi:hypothetical protein
MEIKKGKNIIETCFLNYAWSNKQLLPFKILYVRLLNTA